MTTCHMSLTVVKGREGDLAGKELPHKEAKRTHTRQQHDCDNNVTCCHMSLTVVKDREDNLAGEH
jgi:hypothetical protein